MAHRYIEGVLDHEVDPGTILAVLDGTILGAFLLNNYHPRCGVIEVHAAATSRRWFTIKVFNQLAAFVFKEIRCQALVLRTHPTNAVVRRFGRLMGFTEHEIPRLRGRETSEIVMVLADDVWAARPKGRT